ncbi:hypothetical protein [Nocardioides jejuensis]|uniref:Uncharacterized protein n=1 Tax=Nocardioides jejuensis TaxID=2502782 RepID=A0A4R1BXF8_9ACTN|nr:hypothetical protein [Nocardioides jejuensis]TCJ22724.1 hypothetical protein EPD65_12300 [Nocardioides jejuensis]
MATESSTLIKGSSGARFVAGLVSSLLAATGANYLWLSSGPDGDAFFKPTLLVAAVTGVVGLAMRATSGLRSFGLGCVVGAALSLPVTLAAMWGLFLTVGS